jgi:hypothetical protein
MLLARMIRAVLTLGYIGAVETLPALLPLAKARHPMAATARRAVVVLGHGDEVVDEIAHDAVHAQAKMMRVVIGGYRFKFDWKKGAQTHQQQVTALANEVDRAVRAAIATVAPEALYPTEPNMLIKAIDSVCGDGIVDRGVTDGFGADKAEGGKMKERVLKEDKAAAKETGEASHPSPILHPPTAAKNPTETAIVTDHVGPEEHGPEKSFDRGLTAQTKIPGNKANPGDKSEPDSAA